jgi:hypothetical protein
MHHTVKPLKMVNEFNIVYELPYLEKYVSAGHVATDWALNNGYDEIHLWGFDSIWADTQETVQTRSYHVTEHSLTSSFIGEKSGNHTNNITS